MTIIKLLQTTLLSIIVSQLLSCGGNTTISVDQPIASDYVLGEQWVWKYKGVTTKGEVRSEGEDTRRIVNFKQGLGMLIEGDTVAIADIVKVDSSETPKYKWPLQVGKTWVYEQNWTSQDGTTGKQHQNVEVLSYQEETVQAGTFMAFTIKYSGTMSNSRGYNAPTQEVWLYAPELKNFIKLTQDQGDFHYEEELIQYTK
ncbi:MAG: hypothetical protein ACPGRE_08500 [Flavobacteriaceae bacterium]